MSAGECRLPTVPARYAPTAGAPAARLAAELCGGEVLLRRASLQRCAGGGVRRGTAPLSRLWTDLDLGPIMTVRAVSLVVGAVSGEPISLRFRRFLLSD